MESKGKRSLLTNQTFEDGNGVVVVNAAIAEMALLVTANDLRKKAARTVCKICAYGVKCEAKNGEGCSYLQEFIEELSVDD